MYGRYYNELNQTHNTAIRQFAKDNEDCTRALADVSDWALFNELRARGYHGKVWNTAKDDEFIETLNNKLLVKDDEQEIQRSGVSANIRHNVLLHPRQHSSRIL
jgi:hypothetical protein